jgi:hypothetical protein
MRIITYSLLAAALVVGACKKSEEHKAAEKYEKAREDVRKEVRDVQKETKDLVKEGEELSKAEQQLMAAAAEYRRILGDRLVELNQQIAVFEQRSDRKSQETAARLRAHYRELEGRMQGIQHRATDPNWEQFKNETNRQVEQLQHDLDAATRGSGEGQRSPQQ